MKLKKFLISFMLMLMAISLALSINVFAKEDEKNEDFKGTRTFSIYSDLSNLKNYIQGGRSSLEYIIRMNNIEWLNLELSSDNYNLKLDFSFDFNSYEDYLEKIKYLLTYEPSIINEDGTYIEGFSTRELANYLKDNLQANDLYASDTNIVELFSSGESKIVFSDKREYTAETERIKNQKDEDIELLLKSLKIDTKYDKEEKVFTRKIDFEISTESDSLLNSMKKSFISRCEKEEVEYKNEEIKKFSVEFSRNTEEELASTTMVLLNVGESIGLKEQYGSGNKLKVIFAEYLDVKDILVKDEPEYSYTFDISDYEKAKLIDGYNESAGFTLDENKILSVTEPKTSIKFEYQKDFEFDKVEIITDFTNDWHITRTISMRARTIIAKNMHDKIKNSILNIVPDGLTFNIYDKGAYRYYDIVLTGDVNKINTLTSKIVDGDSKLKVSQMLLPFMPSKVEDNITIGQICSYVKNYKNIEYKYIFNKDTKLPNEKELNVVQNENGTKSVIFKTNNISITYKEFDKILFAKVLILVIIVITLILFLKYKIKRFAIKLKERKESKESKKLENARKKETNKTIKTSKSKDKKNQTEEKQIKSDSQLKDKQVKVDNQVQEKQVKTDNQVQDKQFKIDKKEEDRKRKEEKKKAKEIKKAIKKSKK